MPTPAALTLRTIRAKYRAIWSRDWPEDDAYLATLWSEARATHNATRAHVPPPIVWDTVLDLMRADHPFPVSH
jgi:hypothetical protein